MIGVLAALALYAWLPHNLPTPAVDLGREARSLGRMQVILAMLISVASSASLFSVFTYITPTLENLTHLSQHDVTVMLLLFGAGLTVGNIVGGRLADWKLMPSVIGTLLCRIPVLGAFTFTSLAILPVAMTLFAWGLLAFALVSPLQTRVVDAAAGAPNLASTLNQSAFNFGNAIGAWAGGIGLTLGMSFDALPVMGVALSVMALLLTVTSYGIDRLTPSKQGGSALAG